eukprot:9622867-Karenia_brevis.AAC.1
MEHEGSGRKRKQWLRGILDYGGSRWSATSRLETQGAREARKAWFQELQQMGWPTGLGRLRWMCYLLVDAELYEWWELLDNVELLEEQAGKTFTNEEWDSLRCLSKKSMETP